MTAQRANFDRIARAYRTLEYLTLGRALEACRFHHLAALEHRRRVLVLGDGDGRFVARLLHNAPDTHIDAVDTSQAMLRLLRVRCPAALHLRTHCADALAFARSLPPAHYDAVVTHFFLDCLTQAEVESLAEHVAASMKPGALWLVSDFRIPAGWLNLPAKALVRLLYAAFRVLTNLRVNHLPDHESSFTKAGLRRLQQHISLAGILTTELWSKP